MVIERPSPLDNKHHEVTVVDPENPEAHGIKFEFMTHDQWIYGYDDYGIGVPNEKTAWQQFKLPLLRSIRSGARPINVKYMGRERDLATRYIEDIVSQEETGMRYVLSDVGNDYVRDIDNLDDEDGLRIATRDPTGDSMRAVAVFSPVNAFDKFSENYRDCISLIGFGQEFPIVQGTTGSPISFLSHITPQLLFDKQLGPKFTQVISDTVNDLASQSRKGTMQLTIACGRMIDPEMATTYWKAVREIGRIVKEEVGVAPQIMVTPDTHQTLHGQHVYVRTREHKAYISRASQVDQPELKHALTYTFDDFEKRLEKGVPEREWWEGDFG